jgi:hypothetical protein
VMVFFEVRSGKLFALCPGLGLASLSLRPE